MPGCSSTSDKNLENSASKKNGKTNVIKKARKFNKLDSFENGKIAYGAIIGLFFLIRIKYELNEEDKIKYAFLASMKDNKDINLIINEVANSILLQFEKLYQQDQEFLIQVASLFSNMLTNKDAKNDFDIAILDPLSIKLLMTENVKKLKIGE